MEQVAEGVERGVRNKKEVKDREKFRKRSRSTGWRRRRSRESLGRTKMQRRSGH